MLWLLQSDLSDECCHGISSYEQMPRLQRGPLFLAFASDSGCCLKRHSNEMYVLGTLLDCIAFY